MDIVGLHSVAVVEHESMSQGAAVSHEIMTLKEVAESRRERIRQIEVSALRNRHMGLH